MKDELDLLPTDKRQRFLQIAVVILSVHTVKHESLLQIDFDGDVQAFQSSQNSKVARSLQYLKKEI